MLDAYKSNGMNIHQRYRKPVARRVDIHQKMAEKESEKSNQKRFPERACARETASLWSDRKSQENVSNNWETRGERKRKEREEREGDRGRRGKIKVRPGVRQSPRGVERAKSN